MPKRKDTRYVLRCSAVYRGYYGTGQGTVQDLSLKGCRIDGAQKVQCGGRLSVHLSASADVGPIQIDHAVVQWIQQSQFGVKFIRMSMENETRLRQCLTALHREKSDPPEQLSPTLPHRPLARETIMEE